MKRKYIIAAAAVLCCLTACSNQTENADANAAATASTTVSESLSEEGTSPEENASEDVQTSSGSNILIAYFSVPETAGVDAEAGASRIVIDGQVKGNIQFMAEAIAENVDGDLFRIETVQEYPGEHDKLVDFAADELSADARPELSSHIENIDDYDTVFIGYPNWWADMPMPLYTFFDEYDFSGKTIIPFTSHGGSGFSGTINSIAEIEPNANVITDGFSVSRNNTHNSTGDIADWLNGLGY
ncbi:MAG: flavodoxin [Oscillospiraceae bacterium]|nr:flavodoxin [Oscillospiraceae bacterium]